MSIFQFNFRSPRPLFFVNSNLRVHPGVGDSSHAVLNALFVISPINEGSAKKLKNTLQRMRTRLPSELTAWNCSVRVRFDFTASKNIHARCLEILRKAIGVFPGYDRFSLICKSMKDEDIASILQLLQNTPKSLEVYSKEMGISSVRTLSPFLLNEDDPLLSLSLTINRMSHHALYELAEALKKTSSLLCFQINNLQFAEGQIELLREGLASNSSIKRLELVNCRNLEWEDHFLTEILTNKSIIQELILTECSDRLVREVAQGMPQAQQLRRLSIVGGNGRGFLSEDIESLVRAVGAATSLRDLRLSNVGLSEDHAAVLVEALNRHPALENLNLSNSLLLQHRNRFGDSGINALAKILKSNTRLEAISLIGNSFGPGPICKILSALEFNDSLQDIDGMLRKNWSYEDVNLFSTRLMSIIERVKSKNGTFALPSLHDELKNLLQADEIEIPKGVRELATFVIRNRHNQRQKQVSLLHLLFQQTIEAIDFDHAISC